MSSPFPRREVQHDSVGFPLRVSYQAEIKVMATLASYPEVLGRNELLLHSLRLLGDFCSLLCSDWCHHFLVACQLWAAHSQLLEPSICLLTCPPSFFKPAMASWVESLSGLESLSHLLFWHYQRKRSAFKDLTFWGQARLDYLHILRSTDLRL